MHPSPSLVNGSIEDAADALADRTIGLRYCMPRMPRQFLEKTSFLQEAGQNLGQWWQGLDPAARASLVGTGIGGGMGLASSLLQDKEDRQPLGSAVTGALAGGAFGAGLGLANKYGRKPGPGGESLAEGQFYHPQTGEVYQYQNEVSDQVRDQITAAQSQAQGYGSAVGTALETAGKPVAGAMLTPEGLAGTATAGTGLGLKAWASSGKAPDWLKKYVSPINADTRAASSKTPDHLYQGASRAVKGELDDILENTGVKGERPGTQTTHRTGGSFEANVPDKPTKFNYAKETINRIYNEPDFLKQVLDDPKILKQYGIEDPEGLVAQLKEEGIRGQELFKWPEWMSGAKGKGGTTAGIPQVRRSLLGTMMPSLFDSHVVKGSGRSMLGRAGKWAGPIALAMAGANLIGGTTSKSQASTELEQLISQHAKPVPRQ
jgi:hypothetical protein